MFSGDSINHVADIIRKDQIWKEADDMLTAEEGKNQFFFKKNLTASFFHYVN